MKRLCVNFLRDHGNNQRHSTGSIDDVVNLDWICADRTFEALAADKACGKGSSSSRGRGRRSIRLARRSVAGCGKRPVLADTQRTLAVLEHIAGVEGALHLDSCRAPGAKALDALPRTIQQLALARLKADARF